jgi:glycosyltransferase involved in cell wall biosynthesis
MSTFPHLPITALILTYNEEANLRRTLDRLTWIARIVIIDSGSTDATLNIARTYPQVVVYHRPFDTHAQQWNFGLQQVTTPWVLALDADYNLSPQLCQELQATIVAPQYDAYFVAFEYVVGGSPLHGSVYPPCQVLFRRNKSHYIDDGHTQRLVVNGTSGQLLGKIWHDDRKSLSRWLASQDRYIQIEAHKLATTPAHELNLADRIRKRKLLAPFAILAYCLIVKRCLLDGWRGWYYAFQRMLVEILLSLRLIEQEKLAKQIPPGNS